MLRKLFIAALLLGFLAVLALAGFLGWGYYYITRDMPNLQSVEDYKPPAVSYVYAADGTVLAEFYRERRYPVKLKDVPQSVRNAFIAAEDASFYQHPGIDLLSIFRAFVRNLQAGSVKQGGSTITQQVVKNLLLSDEKKLRRKIKEAVLSYRIEKRLSKDDILEMYLNQIFFGNTAYGLKAAALIYYHKELGELTVAEAAMLAGLPKAPSRYSPISHLNRARMRQKYVLRQMVKAGFISQEEADAAALEKLRIYPADQENIRHAPYFVTEVRRQIQERFRDLNVDTDGLQIHTTADLGADRMGVAALRRGLREVDKRRGWRGPVHSYKSGERLDEFLRDYRSRLPAAIEAGTVYPALVTEVNRSRAYARVDLGAFSAQVNLAAAGWARRYLDREDRVRAVRPEEMLKAGDVIEVSFLQARNLPEVPAEAGSAAPRFDDAVLDQSPEIEGALTLLDPHSGDVLAMVGGYDYRRSQFNRVTQSLRQPGSAFKPIVYLTAVDAFGFTPSTIVHDTPRTFKVGDEFWAPGNFDEKYLGDITLRTALEKSRNLVSVDIVSRIGIESVIQYARKVGIQSKLGLNLSLSLGSSEVTLLELTRAYGVLAARGVLFDSNMLRRIVSRDGQLLYDGSEERLNRANRAINENSAFIMANMMKGVVERGTGTRVKALGRPVAGKTGTSNEEMDTWFIGFTPQWTCGVWVGFDLKKRIGEKETGGRVAAPVFLYFMEQFLKSQDEKNYQKLVDETRAEAARLGIEYVAPQSLPPLDFSPPDGVDPFWIDRSTGRPVDPAAPGAFQEYFVRGTEPATQEVQEQTVEYLESPDL